jgi:hypothetical protein
MIRESSHFPRSKTLGNAGPLTPNEHRLFRNAAQVWPPCSVFDSHCLLDHVSPFFGQANKSALGPGGPVRRSSRPRLYHFDEAVQRAVNARIGQMREKSCRKVTSQLRGNTLVQTCQVGLHGLAGQTKEYEIDDSNLNAHRRGKVTLPGAIHCWSNQCRL